jgi:hypothetical protein
VRLSVEQMDAVMGHLDQVANDTRLSIDSHLALFSSVHDQDRSAITTIQTTVLRALKNTRARALESDLESNKWAALAQLAEDNMQSIGDDYTATGTVAGILQQTGVATVEEVKDDIAAGAKAALPVLAAAVPWWAVVAVAAVAAWKLGVFGRKAA